MKTDLFEQLRLLCYSKAEVAKIIGVSNSMIYGYSSQKCDIPEGIQEKILQIIAGGKNQKFVKRAFEVQKHVAKQKKTIVHTKKDN
ncbi:MAG: hypothetical protein ACOYMA_19080 [Bacteroidia bacterium]